MSETGRGPQEQQDLGARIREGMARRRMSRLQLADAAKLSVSTLEKGLSGERPFSIATLIRIEDAIGIRLRPSSSPGAQAAAELGAYRREGVEWLVGSYLTLRPSFEKPGIIYAYMTEISWNDEAGHLSFSEKARLDAHFAQKGAVSMPYQSGHIYLVTNEHGQYRLMTLGRPSIAGDMYGLLTTLRSARGGRLTPVAAPIALLRWDAGRKGEPALGQIAEGDARYADYRREVDRICEEEFVALIS
ncbi:helix-turn-helix domain-containing protein [Sphingomonas sp. LB-2]|uniref:helix-turn-helix domain-containing protein n=1 Tax=Sphingomonas caeni TaxID=2984949 RepID=UPI00223148B6|nr:helix-turn-helix transcriptional regulator [Sphingomonas caeni]MCW3848868.1 helix-turn-helix domain-containing protein [Sphingomonas caeni]